MAERMEEKGKIAREEFRREEWMEREEIYVCWLCNFPDIGNRQLHQLWELCGSAENVYFADRGRWGQVLSEKQVKSLVEYTASWKPVEEYSRMRGQGIRLLNVRQGQYPQALKEIPDAPFGLFVRGNLPRTKAPTVAIIGARDCSEYGKYMARELGAAMGKAGVTVVSGMARGIDGIAQEAALAAGGTSVGVLGSGVDVCYPSQNRAIYEALIAGGAVVSSYPLGTPARPQNFPPRNRIVSGLADAVIVIEARAKSGTLITVDTGLEQGKEIYAVPGRVTDRLSDGCNYLIKQGAGVILSPKDFLDELWELWECKQGVGSVKGGANSGVKGSTEERGMSEERLTAEEKEGRSGWSKTAGEKELRNGQDKAEQVSELQKERIRVRKAIREYKGEEDKIADVLRELSPELGAIYRLLDSTPRSVEEIRNALPPKYQNLQISTYLMKLCMEKRAIQVSPGQFCRWEN